MPKKPAISQNKRLLLWSVLGFALVASVGFLLRGFGGSSEAEELPLVAHIRLIDDEGEPVHTAEPRVLVPADRRDAPLRIRWTSETATIDLPVLPLKTKLLVVAPGFRITHIGDLERSRDVVLERGIPIRLKVKGDAPAMNPPLVGLLRIRPTDKTMEVHEEGTEFLMLDITSLMVVQYPSRADALELPNRHYGFAASEEDASIGLRLPKPGKYLVRWGILDERPGTWFTLPDAKDLEIEVQDLVTPQVFEVEVTRDLWNRTRAGLQKMVTELSGG